MIRHGFTALLASNLAITGLAAAAPPPALPKPAPPAALKPGASGPSKPAARPATPSPGRSAEEALVRSFVRAFNAHDVTGMLRFCDPGIRWMNIEGQTLSAETTGNLKLDEAMRVYFKSTPSAHSDLRGVVASGPFVSTIEEASWVRGGKKRQQCSIGVYEIRDSRIRNVWYFPPHDCGSPRRP
jgi:hypothetical protein